MILRTSSAATYQTVKVTLVTVTLSAIATPLGKHMLREWTSPDAGLLSHHIPVVTARDLPLTSVASIDWDF